MPPTVIDLFGVKIPLPQWSLSWLAIVVIAALIVFFWQKLSPTDALALKTANAQMELSVREYGRHLVDQATETYAENDGTFTVKAFADHCVIIVRRIGDRVLTKLVPDLSADLQVLPKQASTWPSFLSLFVTSLRANGRCMNPHPGQFRSWYGQRNGCFVQVYREWPDSCVHYQSFNSCSGYWDTNNDGSPRVYWQRCNH